MKLIKVVFIPVISFFIVISSTFPASGKMVVGQSCALSGPTSFLGTHMNKGALAYFNTRKNDIILEALDDKYEPVQCIYNTKMFIRKKVKALFGYVGTPTSKVAVPLATKEKMIFFGAFTGAGFLSDYKTNPYTFSLRASYDAEIENMVRHLKEDLNITKIGLFVQRDAFGLAGIKGAVRAVNKISGVSILPAVPPIPPDNALESVWKAFWEMVPNYKRNTVSVGIGARKLYGYQVEAVILVGAYRPCATAINMWHKRHFNAVFINISFVGSMGIATRCKSLKNVYVSQVMPSPWEGDLPIVKEYQAAMGRDFDFVSLEGYVAAKVFHKALVDAGANPDADAIKTALESMSDYDAGGLKISYGASDHRGLETTYLTKLEKKDGKYKFIYVDKLTRE